jgi:hypothetical protein
MASPYEQQKSCKSQKIHLDIGKGYGLDGQVSIQFFSSAQRPDQLWDQPNLLSNGYREGYPEVKGMGNEADHSPPFNTEAKNIGAIPSLPVRLKGVMIN